MHPNLSMAEIATHPEAVTLHDLLALDVTEPRRQAIGHNLMTGHRVGQHMHTEHGPAYCLDCPAFLRVTIPPTYGPPPTDDSPFPALISDAVQALLRDRPTCPCHGLPCIVDDDAMRRLAWDDVDDRYAVTIHWCCSVDGHWCCSVDGHWCCSVDGPR